MNDLRSMRRRLRVVPLLALLSLAPACSSGDDDDTDESPTPATFTQVRDTVLLPSCGFSSCHGAGSGGLTLNEETSYDALVNAPSEARPDMVRVKPGDPDNSYLMWKLEAREGIVGDEMPPGTQLEAERLELVRSWIEAGAMEN